MKSKLLPIALLLLGVSILAGRAQKLSFNGQVSGFHLSKIESPWQTANSLRYIPELKWNHALGKTWKFDAEASANMDARLQYTYGDSISGAFSLKPYRIWGRFSSERFEIRAGLQKINFGSASMLRPLMWFDRMDPRDPLQLTEGVYGLLGRYFFQNNANIWLWGLLPGKSVKGWEMLVSDRKMPEFGGRFQLPAGPGEIAISGHFRRIAAKQPEPSFLSFTDPLPEYRVGIDGKWDLGPGVWFEGTYSWYSGSVSRSIETAMLTLGTDYTLPLGNGLTVMAEHFLYQLGRYNNPAAKSLNFTASSVTYPINLTHSLSAMVFYNWTSNDWYRFINWRINLSHISLYLMAFWNPDTFDLYQNTGNSNLMAGKGLQILFVWNH